MTIKAKSIAERILWASLGIVGMAWIIFFVERIIEDENPSTVRRDRISLADIEYPAITICSEQTTKYAFAERLGNYLDPEKELPHELKKIQRILMDKMRTKYDSIYRISCKKTAYRTDEECKVNQLGSHCKSMIVIKGNYTLKLHP